MSDLAAKIYPHLANDSAAAPAAPASAPASRPREGGERTAAQAIYGDPADGLAKAREGIASGVARPAGEPAPPPAERAPPGDWLAEAAKDLAPEPDAAEPAADGEFGAASPHLVEKLNTLTTGLSPANREKLVELHREALTDASTQYWTETAVRWERETRREFGGRLDAAIAPVKRALADDRLTSPEFRRILAEYKLGNNVHVIKTLAAWAKAMRR